METSRELLFADVRHACATYGIRNLRCFTPSNGTALFKGIYYNNLMRDQEWCFLAKARKSGGISIKRVSRLSPSL